MSTTVLNATSVASSMSSATASPTQTGSGGNGNNGGGGGGSSSSPLLFFVALGFGVVFTNLWIIVGVKYCFRYNQRNRALRAHADGDPIDLTVMPRPHRRRREKKLMTMEEVNTKFPLVKYKAWRATREKEGLPTAGGISLPPSRAASVKDVDGVLGRKSPESNRPGSPLSDSAQRPLSTGSRAEYLDARENQAQTVNGQVPAAGAATTSTPEPQSEHVITSEKTTQVEIPPARDAAGKVSPPAQRKSSDDDDDDDDMDDNDPIENAISHDPELLGNPGDTCAICLDVLEDDDDVRGLTCGHAFHGACVDPWLTGRRACCPLCKADYYTPKPRPDGEAAATGTNRRSTNGLRLPQSPQRSWLGGRSRLLLVGINRNGSRRADASARAGQSVAPTQQTSGISNGFMSIRWPFRRRTGNESGGQVAGREQPTPAQLEAGVRASQ